MQDTRPVYLIQPPANLSGRKPCLDDTQYGLGLLALSAWLEQHDFKALGLHVPLALYHGFALDELVNMVAQGKPLLVAIGMNWVHFSQGAIELATLIKRALPECPIVVGGQHASLFAAEIMARHGAVIDGVIVGEAERPLLAACRSLRENGSMDVDVPGLARPDGSMGAPSVVPEIDALPLYSYRALRPRPRQEDVAALSTTRGACPFRCAWCIEPVVGRVQGRPRLSFHSSARIADQIERLMGEGIDRFTIQDNFFVGGDRHLINLALTLRKRRLRPRHLNLFAHPDSYGRAGFLALAESCERSSVDFGVETGSVAVARKNHRTLDPDGVVASIDAAVVAGVEPYTWWMVGLPGEGPDELAETEQLIERTMHAGGIPRWVSPLILFPKTPIHEQPHDYGVSLRFRGFDDYARFSTTTLSEALTFSDVQTHHTEQASADEIGQASRRLRRFIAERFGLLEDFYRGHAQPPDLASTRQRVAASFF